MLGYTELLSQAERWNITWQAGKVMKFQCSWQQQPSDCFSYSCMMRAVLKTGWFYNCCKHLFLTGACYTKSGPSFLKTTRVFFWESVISVATTEPSKTKRIKVLWHPKRIISIQKLGETIALQSWKTGQSWEERRQVWKRSMIWKKLLKILDQFLAQLLILLVTTILITIRRDKF